MENLLLLKKLNGRAVLKDILEKSVFGSIEQTVASLTLFSHPKTVKQLNYLNVFRIIRTRLMSSRGEYDMAKRVMLDDNTGPTEAFIWANGIKRNYEDITFNHVWSNSNDIESNTNLANICVTPAFLSKLTDTDSKIQNLLRYRSFDLYDGWHPKGTTKPTKPDLYDNMKWVPPLPEVVNVEKIYRDAMKTKRQNRTKMSAHTLGWHFSNDLPDDKI